MGGGGGGGGFSSGDATKVQEAAEARLKAIASKSTKVLFVCEATDKKSLELHLAQSKVFSKDRTALIDATQANKVDAELEKRNFPGCFHGRDKSHRVY